MRCQYSSHKCIAYAPFAKIVCIEHVAMDFIIYNAYSKLHLVPYDCVELIYFYRCV